MSTSVPFTVKVWVAVSAFDALNVISPARALSDAGSNAKPRAVTDTDDGCGGAVVVGAGAAVVVGAGAAVVAGAVVVAGRAAVETEVVVSPPVDVVVVDTGYEYASDAPLVVVVVSSSDDAATPAS